MFRYTSLIFLVLAVTCRSETGHRHLRSVWNALFQPPAVTATEESPQSSSVCAGCNPKYTVTEEELTALRIEYIKNQILKKLRLKEKPTVSFADLPIPVTADDSFLPLEHNDYLDSQYGDDYYGKTTQVIVFPLEGETPCVRKLRYPSACLPFRMPKDVHHSDVSMAELWIHKEKDSLDSHNQTFVVSEFAHWDPKQSFQKTKPIAIHGTNLTEGWVKIDVAWAVKNWLEFHRNEPIHALNIACKTCAMPHDSSPISNKANLKPFLVMYTYSEQRRTNLRRPKRQVNCGVGAKQECCRESLYVSFAEIGWDDWILQPEGYNAYFCRGSCTAAAAVTLSATQHNSILQKVMYGVAPNKNSGVRLDLTPCCAGTHFQPLELLYMYNNKTITKKLLPNMIVDQCGCM